MIRPHGSYATNRPPLTNEKRLAILTNLTKTLISAKRDLSQAELMSAIANAGIEIKVLDHQEPIREPMQPPSTLAQLLKQRRYGKEIFLNKGYYNEKTGEYE